MFVALWEFEVKPGCEERFEKVYGSEGAWSKLFWKDRNFRGTRLLRDVARKKVYVTLDFWATRRAYEKFMIGHAKEYQKLDLVGKDLTVREKKIGGYEG